MAVVAEYTQPKGNQGMILIGTSNNDSTIAFPTLEFSFLYNNAYVNTIFSSGNSWIGIGAGSEHISINRSDNSYNNLFYANETEYGLKVFRIRFEGNSYYRSWGSNDLIWEFSVFEDGVMRLVIEKTPNTASDNFSNPGGAAFSVRFETGKSYIFTSQNENGTNFFVEEGTYLPCKSKFLFVDEEGVKSYLQTEALSAWSKVADPPVTETMFIEHGVDVLPNDLTGLLNQATLCYFTDNPSVVTAMENYTLEVKQVVTSKPKVIIQKESFQIVQSRRIRAIEVVTSEVGGIIGIAISVDNGVSYSTFFKGASTFVPINITDVEEFVLNGMRASDLMDMDYEVLNQMVGETLSFAYVLEKPTLNDVCKLKAVKIRYEE